MAGESLPLPVAGIPPPTAMRVRPEGPPLTGRGLVQASVRKIEAQARPGYFSEQQQVPDQYPLSRGTPDQQQHRNEGARPPGM